MFLLVVTFDECDDAHVDFQNISSSWKPFFIFFKHDKRRIPRMVDVRVTGKVSLFISCQTLRCTQTNKLYNVV